MILGVHHFSLTVSNLSKSVEFYAGILNAKILSDTTVQESCLHSVTHIPDAKLRNVFLSVHGQLIELIQYLSPIGKPVQTRTCDTGSSHIAFIVDNIDSAYRNLQSKGVQFKSGPVVTGSTPDGILKCVYFLDPDGITLELVEVG